MSNADLRYDFDQVPLELRQSPQGWVVVCYDRYGRARHLANVDSEIQAFRTARRMVSAYALRGDALVVSGERTFYYEIDRLLQPGSRRLS